MGELHKMGLGEKKNALKNRGELSELEMLGQERESSLSFGIYMYLNIKHYFHGILHFMAMWDLKELRSLDNENPSDIQKAHTTMR